MSDITRCYVICEGQSEEKFINETLSPYFHNVKIYLTPLTIPTSKGHKGGALSYERVVDFIVKKLKQDTQAFMTTMFDYYGLDDEFLKENKADTDIYEYIEKIQKDFDEAIKQKCNTNKFFSYIQPHEFESLLFSDITKIIEADAEWDEKLICELECIIEKYNNPELINNSKETSPSHRLKNIFSSPSYKKVLHGSKIAKEIGIDNIRLKCQHFNKWCEKIDALKAFK
ncbi:DUF4276 family protein [Campylobacter lari]|uniref:DUF4276 family protein n=2 Tax=Campylobacter TaxID=194 RepID=A0A5C7DVV8_9BACT|nr:DUF4276 family protein [Campylobacter volucris]EAH8849770.1 DUF4276 family protein [Campylobacter lari]EAI3897823.1 DUF4276 family protein [Campylobacter lari]EAI5630915.1 DUF4276 family protein [Campylobacter lari]EAI7261781.1 DUF4276 family protein [Campylobacter lari]EAJ0361250.1 DUF4276 family protein [Campylobacter lari]